MIIVTIYFLGQKGGKTKYPEMKKSGLFVHVMVGQLVFLSVKHLLCNGFIGKIAGAKEPEVFIES